MTRNREPVPPEPKRRQTLKRLGLAVGAAYMAPVLLSLGAGHAQESGGEAESGGPGWNKPTKPDKPSKPDKPEKSDAKDS